MLKYLLNYCLECCVKAPRAGPDRCYQILIIYYLLQIACYHYLSIWFLQRQWENEQNLKRSLLERKYQENLAEIGLAHQTASEVNIECYHKKSDCSFYCFCTRWIGFNSGFVNDHIITLQVLVLFSRSVFKDCLRYLDNTF